MYNRIETTLPESIIYNPHLVGNPKPSGVIAITWSDKHGKYTIRMINGECSPEYLGFIARHTRKQHLWYTYTKIGAKIPLNLNIQDVVQKLSRELLTVCDLVWLCTKTDNALNWEIYYV